MSRTKQLKLEADIEESYLKISSYDARKFELAAQDDWLFWTRKTFVKFIFLYKNNEMNKRLKRSGRVANYTKGGRIGTRNLALIPAIDQPASRNTDTSSYRYYDISRANAVKNADGTSTGLDPNPTLQPGAKGQWRSVGSDRITVVTAYWDPEKNEWINL